MKYKVLFAMSLALMILPLVLPRAAWYLGPVLSLILLRRNKRQLSAYLRFFFPSVVFLLILYTLLGTWRQGLHTAALLFSSSLSLQLYFAFFPGVSVFELLLNTGFPRPLAFALYAVLNYVSFISPVIREIQDAQRLRGLDFPKGPRGIFRLPALLIPLVARLLRGADHLAESLFLRTGDGDAGRDSGFPDV